MSDNRKKAEAKAAVVETGPPEIEALMKSVTMQPGVEGFMIFNDSGIPIKWTSTFVKQGTTSSSNPTPIPASVVHHAALIGDLCAKAKLTAAKLLGDGDGEVQLLRLHTKKSEILIAPSAECTLVVSQRAHSATFYPTE